MTVLKRILGGLLALIALLAIVMFGPLLFRQDEVAFRWDRAFGGDVLQQPIGAAYRAGRLYVSDAEANAVIVFDTAGSVVGRWAGGPDGLERPMHLAFGSEGELYVPEYVVNRVAVLDSAGDVVRRTVAPEAAGLGSFEAPAAARVRRDTLFVADFFNHRVLGLQGVDVWRIGQPAKDLPGRLLPGRLHYPTDIAIDDSLIYVADAYNNRIQVFRPNGELVRRWGGALGLGFPGPFRGWFSVATGVELGPGRVYVADFYNDRIQIFSREGGYLGQVADSLHLPTDVVSGPRGDLYVVDFGHKRIVHLVPGTPDP